MPDLIILDVVMPTQDGGDLYKTLRAQAEFRHTPIIFITGAVDTPTYNNGMIFLPKTLKFAQITAEIQKALAAKPRENSARDARPV
jgi:CheY-like chemotaxis protein